MRYLLVILLGVCVGGCATSGYKQFYKSYVDPTTLPDVQLLAPGQAPTIYSSNEMNRDVKILISKGFRPIGHSAFNGALEGEQQASAQAVRVGAQVVLVKSDYTNTQTNTIPLFLPNNTTTYGSGSVYGSGGSASYYGSSTAYGTAVVPITSQQRRFDQEAVYFVKSTKRLKFGVFFADLTPEMRASIQRNMGAVIDIVMENSPAFTANVLPGDILIQIDGVDVRNAEHAAQLMDAAPPGGEIQISVLRNGEKKTIAIRLRAS